MVFNDDVRHPFGCKVVPFTVFHPLIVIIFCPRTITTNDMPKKSAFTNEQKLTIALEARSYILTQQQIASKYNIAQSQVSRWVTQFAKLGWKLPDSQKNKKYLPGGGRKSIYSTDIQDEIISFVSDPRFYNYPVTVRRIVIHLKSKAMIEGSPRDKAVAKRIRHILNKNGIVRHQKADI
jgi:transposase